MPSNTGRNLFRLISSYAQCARDIVNGNWRVDVTGKPRLKSNWGKIGCSDIQIDFLNFKHICRQNNVILVNVRLIVSRFRRADSMIVVCRIEFFDRFKFALGFENLNRRI